MDLQLELTRLIIESRGGTAENVSLNNLNGPVTLCTYIAHTQCQQEFAYCRNAVILEIWTLSVSHTADTNEKVCYCNLSVLSWTVRFSNG